MDRVFASVPGNLLGPGASMPSALTIDLRNVQFVDPGGMTCLWAAVHALRARRQDVTLLMPRSADVLSYMDRMGFFRRMVEEGVACSSRSFTEWSHSRNSPALLELTRIQADDEISVIISTILDRMQQILESQLGYSTRVISDLATALTEACRNVVDHSSGTGVAAVQTYVRSGTREVRISVSDCGDGIRSTLVEQYPELARAGDAEAIVMALRKRRSRFRDHDRGLGLYRIKQIVREHSGVLHIRSGEASIAVSASPAARSVSYFPGTHLHIILPAGDG
ncbi:ATP-binding protein [Capsulimonas corticalis]